MFQDSWVATIMRSIAATSSTIGELNEFAPNTIPEEVIIGAGQAFLCIA